MADNIELNLGAGGKIVATDDIGGIQHELVKVEFGTDGNATMVSTGNPLPVTDAAVTLSTASIDLKTPNLGQALSAASIPVVLTAVEEAILSAILTITDFDTKTGSLTETAPATDTASSGLNGRLQRIAQRLTSLIALLPAALGVGGGLKIDGSGTALPISGTVTVTGAGDASASNQTLQITQETAINTVLGLIADAAVAAGATGSVSAKLRAISRDLIANIVLAAGTNVIGKVGIDQTTPGTTNGVQINAALPVGSNVIGKTSIDQTTPGTTNLVALTAETTKAIGVVRTSDGAGNLLTSNSSTFSAKFALDGNLLGTLGTAFSTAGKVDVKSTQKPSYGATSVLAVTALQSLTSSATVGWKSVRTSNLATLATDYEIMISLTTANTAPANDKAMYLYVIPWYTSDAGSTWFAASGGTATLPTSSDAAYTIASPNNFRLLGVLNYTTAQMVCQDVFLLSNCFGNRMPDGFSFCVINFSGAALSTGCILDISPLNDILV